MKSLVLAVTLFLAVWYGAHDAPSTPFRRSRSRRQPASRAQAPAAPAQVVTMEPHRRDQRTLTRRYR